MAPIYEMADRPRSLKPEQSARVSTLLNGRTDISEDFAGFSEAEAVELLMILQGIDEAEARHRLAFARGEISGDVITLK